VTQDWSPLGQGGELLADPVIESIAERVDATPAQVVIAWHLALGHVVIPKTANVHRLAENLAGTQVTLTKADVDAINALDRHDGRIGPDPERASF
jgi:2,5-diketo-D-gluconate reductase A